MEKGHLLGALLRMHISSDRKLHRCFFILWNKRMAGLRKYGEEHEDSKD